MNKLDLAKFFKDVQRVVVDHSPEILTGLGIAGMITTTVLAVKATPKAIKLIEDKKHELEMEPEEKLPVVETVKTVWKPYIPAVITGVSSIVCLVGSCSVSARRNAALAAAYNLSATALADYKEKALEVVGPSKEREIREKVAEDRLTKNPTNESAIVVTGNGTTRCMDSITKRRFTSDIDKINRIVNELNRQMLNGDDYISLNEFYYELGLEECDVGDELGWNVSHGLIQIDYSALVDTDGIPCVVLDYTVAPKRGFNSWR